MSTKTLRNILVCGIPGSGKTCYCEWLEREKDFMHLDFDKLLNGNGTPLKLSLVDLLRKKPEEFIAGLSKRKQPIAIDWGFPIVSLAVARSLQENGVAIWWFDGDREAARQSFDKRGTVSSEAFRIQMESIERNWAEIKEVIGNNLIESVKPGPTHTTPEKIFTRMIESVSMTKPPSF